ncbi:hypothetical protein FSP39_019655 [Pinctada imbricata]|uniref:Uncharacterized protein n=1 Tax=Pinctada imbricata TaxID=66713 RepID=A0AA89C232_PINIB|nr:hypothetical protein FSP39_019655 [Pinctada imbricata]
MLESDFQKKAKFVRLVRDWYLAIDTQGIPAYDRANNLWRSDHFTTWYRLFQLPNRYKIFQRCPVCVTFDGLLIDIDTKLQIYSLTTAYNIRSVGSLAAETTVGLLQAMYPYPQVSIKARGVPSLM